MKINKEKIINCFMNLLYALYLTINYIYATNTLIINISKLIILVFGLVELFYFIKYKKIEFCLPIIFLFAFSLFCLLSNFWAIIDSEASINSAKTLLLRTLFLFISYNYFLRFKNSPNAILKSICFAGIFLGIYVISYYGIGEYITKILNSERIGGEINNVNALGIQTAISFGICMYMVINKKDYKYLLLSTIPLLVVIGSGSRVAFLMVTTILFLLLLTKKDKSKIKNIISTFVIIFIIITLFVTLYKFGFLNNIFDRLTSAFNFFGNNSNYDDSTEERMLFIRAGLKQFFDTPFIGIGIGNSRYITLKVAGWSTYLHCNYVELLACTGIVGFCLYYFAFISLIIQLFRIIKYDDNEKLVMMSLIIILTQLIADIGLISYSSKMIYCYILLAILVIRRNYVKKDN